MRSSQAWWTLRQGLRRCWDTRRAASCPSEVPIGVMPAPPGRLILTDDTPMSCDTPFQIGSNTKMITAAVLMQLQEEGALTLDDPLSRHLPEFAAALPNGDLITLRQLANHTGWRLQLY